MSAGRPAPFLLALLPALIPLLSPAPTSAQAGCPAVAAVEERGTASRRLHALLDSVWALGLEQHPERATFLGHPGFDDAWTDWSMAAIESRREQERQQLEALERIDAAAVDPADRLNLTLALREARLEVEGQRFPSHLLPVDQMDGIQKTIPAVMQATPARTARDLEDHIARLRGVGPLLDQQIELLREGVERGVIHARAPLRDLPNQIAGVAPDDPLESPLLTAFHERPEGVGEPAFARLRDEAVRAYRESARPGYLRLLGYLEDEYIPAARTGEEVGWSAVSNGDAWYRHNVRVETSTELTPAEIHEIGLREVARIRAEMEAIVREVGFEGGLDGFLAFLRTDPRFYHDTPEALLAEYRDIAKRADPELVALFGCLPRLQYGVEPVPAYSERSETTARYRRGSPAAGRPGTFLANTYDLASRPRWEMEALTLHEAVPGHHVQIALAQELEGLPAFRRYSGPTAFVEGWALYAETLGDEMGFYQDPYARFGALTYQMWRAVRLVVDTGLHAQGWSRQQAIDYFMENSSKPEHDVIVEIDRYIVWPGQALAYMIGKLEIEALRERAESALGPAFDIRQFHDTVLGAGAIPLDVLRDRVEAWISDSAPASPADVP